MSRPEAETASRKGVAAAVRASPVRSPAARWDRTRQKPQAPCPPAWRARETTRASRRRLPPTAAGGRHSTIPRSIALIGSRLPAKPAAPGRRSPHRRVASAPGHRHGTAVSAVSGGLRQRRRGRRDETEGSWRSGSTATSSTTSSGSTATWELDPLGQSTARGVECRSRGPASRSVADYRDALFSSPPRWRAPTL